MAGQGVKSLPGFLPVFLWARAAQLNYRCRVREILRFDISENLSKGTLPCG